MKFKIKEKDSGLDRALYALVRSFKKKTKVVNLNNQPFAKRCILIANHNGANGPLTYRSKLDRYFYTWGAYQMLGGYASRWNYLYHTFYRKKLGYGKFRAFVIATVFGLFSKMIYRLAKILPIYYDMRVKNTFNYSLECLEKDIPILIFPEDSNDGYKEEIGNFASGFLRLSKIYYKRTGEDLPIYPIYFNSKVHRIVIGKPLYAQQVLAEHTETEALQIFADEVNNLNSMIKAGEVEDLIVDNPITN